MEANTWLVGEIPVTCWESDFDQGRHSNSTNLHYECIRLPKTITKDINTIMSRCWWGHKDSTNKMAWMAWKGMGRSKKMRGLGFRELDSFNVALLAK